MLIDLDLLAKADGKDPLLVAAASALAKAQGGHDRWDLYENELKQDLIREVRAVLHALS